MPLRPCNQGVRALRRRWIVSLLVTAVLVAGLAGLPAARRPILRAVGWVLVVNDAIGPTDIIVAAGDAFGCGVLEAADLVQGVPYEDATAAAVRQLRALGVETIEIIPTGVTGTEDEARAEAGSSHRLLGCRHRSRFPPLLIWRHASTWRNVALDRTPSQGIGSAEFRGAVAGRRVPCRRHAKPFLGSNSQRPRQRI
jgi:hypothetical protein